MNYWHVHPHGWISQKLFNKPKYHKRMIPIIYDSRTKRINQYRSRNSGDLWWKQWLGTAQKYLLECRKVLYLDLGGGYSGVYKFRTSLRFKISTLCELLLCGRYAWIKRDKAHFAIKWTPGSIKEKQLSQLQKFFPRPQALVKGGAFHQIHQTRHVM